MIVAEVASKSKVETADMSAPANSTDSIFTTPFVDSIVRLPALAAECVSDALVAERSSADAAEVEIPPVVVSVETPDTAPPLNVTSSICTLPLVELIANDPDDAECVICDET